MLQPSEQHPLPWQAQAVTVAAAGEAIVRWVAVDANGNEVLRSAGFGVDARATVEFVCDAANATADLAGELDPPGARRAERRGCR